VLPRAERLVANRDFQRVYRQGRSYVSSLVVLYVLPTPGDPPPATLVGFVASKKVGKAHDRNLAKRRVREAYRALARREACSALLVWVLRPATVPATYAQIAAAVGELLRQVGRLRLVEDEARSVVVLP